MPNIGQSSRDRRATSSPGSIPSSSRSSSSSGSSDGYEGARSPTTATTAPREIKKDHDHDDKFSFEKSAGVQSYSVHTAHKMVRAAAFSNCFFVPRRCSRLAKVLTTTAAALLLLFLVFGHVPHGLSRYELASVYSSSAVSTSDSTGIAAAGFEARGHHIPPKIWQVMFTPRNSQTGGYDFSSSLLPYTVSWLTKNPDYRYTLIGTEGANRFVMNHFGDDHRVVKTHFGLRNHGPRSDLMRYLIMLVEGGIYSDTDVTCLRPVDTWIPEEWRADVKAIVGIEGDSRGGKVIKGMIWDVQFGQWTVAAVPGHRLFRRMLDQMLDRLEDLVAFKNTTIDQLEMTALEIMNTTAPAGWSECVFAELQMIDPSLKEPKDLSGMKEPRLYGDIMVLPIDGFGMGVWHSGATHDGTIPEQALVRHHFHGSWRKTDGIEGKEEEEEEEEEEEKKGGRIRGSAVHHDVDV